jgi:alkanesulfonate monooxygenase SsuD/methylene tetrahydromethanopterin reductase-like flavin-dependent oxidoreductase (luciferase family)
MSQLILDRPRTVVPTPAGAAATRRGRAPRTTVGVVVPGPQPDGSAPLVFRPGSEAGLALGAARADVVQLGFSARVPSLAAMRRLVEAVEDEIAAVGRERSSVRIVLDVKVVLTDDDAAARRKRAQLDHLDALAGIAWAPSGTRVVAATPGVVDAAVELGERVGADEVVLVPLTGSADVERLRLLVVGSLRAA